MTRIRTLRQIELLAGLLLAILLFAACAAPVARDRERDRVIDDASIQARLQAQLQDDPRLDSEQIQLEVRNGIVTLVGWVGSENERKAIEDVAWKVGGVRQVDNRLQLRQDGG